LPDQVDIAIVGAGAAGLMAAISCHAWRGTPDRVSSGNQPASSDAPRPRVLLLDGAKKPGAKILVAGGGRCNVTHDHVDESAFAGSSRPAIRNILRRFGVEDTIRFFQSRGVELKREETGKLFPTTDDAHTILNTLLSAVTDAGVEFRYPWRAQTIERTPKGFLITRAPDAPLSPAHLLTSSPAQPVLASRLILATGGQSLPKTGSDGHGYALARSLGHTVTRTLPALVPLTLPDGHFLRDLSGITLPAALELRSATGKRLVAFTDSTLLTHFGLSGPSVLDISRYYLDATFSSAAQLVINFLPAHTPDSLDTRLADAGRREGSLSVLRFLSTLIPDRLARALCEHTGLAPATSLASLSKDKRRSLAAAVTNLPLPVTGSRGFAHAEVTAGGVPLSEVHLDTMESRLCPGLYLVGEILDVDGRIGGYNFQWAWASGFIAGSAAALSVTGTPRRTSSGNKRSR
jgi:predicted Rossmann fold flavoprotein